MVQLDGELLTVVGRDGYPVAMDVGLDAFLFEEVEQVGEEGGGPPVGDFGFRVAVGKFIAEVGKPDVVLGCGGLEEGGFKRKDLFSVGTGAFGEEHDELVGVHGLFHGAEGGVDIFPACAVDPDGSGHVDEASDDGPMEDVFFGYERCRAMGAEDEDIEITQMVGEEDAMVRNGAQPMDFDVEYAKQPAGFLLEPERSGTQVGGG